MRTLQITIVAITLMLVVSGVAAGDFDTSTASEKDWRFFISVYGWLAGIDGTVVSAGKEEDIDIPFDDILEVTDTGFMLYAEAKWRKWFFGFDGTWAKLAVQQKGILTNLHKREHRMSPFFSHIDISKTIRYILQ
ncbi:hypothetical protein C6A37_04080 [Desulfobacteraceae bacterium SEEP-SAG9]|nr:hypothetical protein C6A37_04080 [Desulfobacteraceae bacterium SEEP-SAG9]